MDVFVWLLAWLAGWGLYGFMLRRQIDYIKRFPITCVYFLILSILVTILFEDTLARVATDFDLTPLVVLGLAYILTIGVYYLAHTRLRKPERLISANPYEFFLTLDYRYLTSKSIELLFQQIMIVVLILTVHAATTSLVSLIVIYGVIFASAHLAIYPLIGTTGRIFKLVYFFAAVTSAIVFPLLTLRVSYGFVYSYIIHSSFYTLFALFFWAKNRP